MTIFVLDFEVLVGKLMVFFSGLGIAKDSSSKRIRAIAKTEEHIKKNSSNLINVVTLFLKQSQLLLY